MRYTIQNVLRHRVEEKMSKPFIACVHIVHLLKLFIVPGYETDTILMFDVVTFIMSILIAILKSSADE